VQRPLHRVDRHVGVEHDSVLKAPLSLHKSVVGDGFTRFLEVVMMVLTPLLPSNMSSSSTSL
jgi:hypothetical protein